MGKKGRQTIILLVILGMVAVSEWVSAQLRRVTQ